MSRTIRRTRDKKRNKSGRSNFVDDWTTEYVYDYGYLGPRRLVQLEGKAFQKAYWTFHNDTLKHYGGNHPYARKRYEDKCRMKNKNEIDRYLKDTDYEVITYNPGCLSWER